MCLVVWKRFCFEEKFAFARVDFWKGFSLFLVGMVVQVNLPQWVVLGLIAKIFFIFIFLKFIADIWFRFYAYRRKCFLIILVRYVWSERIFWAYQWWRIILGFIDDWIWSFERQKWLKTDELLLLRIKISDWRTFDRIHSKKGIWIGRLARMAMTYGKTFHVMDMDGIIKLWNMIAIIFRI